jgi:hypothetical protein
MLKGNKPIAVPHAAHVRCSAMLVSPIEAPRLADTPALSALELQSCKFKPAAQFKIARSGAVFMHPPGSSRNGNINAMVPPHCRV